MKTFIKGLFAVFIVLLVSGCQSKTEGWVNNLKKVLPIKVGEMGSMADVRMEGNDLMVVLSLKDEAANIFDAENPKTLAANFVRSESLTKMAKDLSNEGHGLILRYVGNPSNRKVDVAFTAGELKDLLAKGRLSKEEVALNALEFMVAETKKRLPVNLDNDFSFVDLTIEDKVFLVYRVEDSKEEPIVLNVEDPDTFIAEFMKSTKEEKDFASVALLKHTVDANKGLGMRYCGAGSEKVVEIGVDAEKLRLNYIKYLSQLIPLSANDLNLSKAK